MRDPRIAPNPGDSLYMHNSRYDVIEVDEKDVTINMNGETFYCSMIDWNETFKNAITEIKDLT